MKAYKFEHLGFEISLPDEWHESMSSKSDNVMNRSVVFHSDDAKKKAIHIEVGALSKFESEPTLDDTKKFFNAYVKDIKIHNLQMVVFAFRVGNFSGGSTYYRKVLWYVSTPQL